MNQFPLKLFLTIRFFISIIGRALLADIYKLPDGKEKILWRGVLSKGENFGDADQSLKKLENLLF